MHCTFSFLSHCSFWSFLQHLTSPAWSLFFLCKPFVLPTPLQRLLPASNSHGRTPFPFAEPGVLLACIGTKRKTRCRGRRKHHLRVSPSASCEGRTARRRWPSPSTEITVRMNLRSWKSQATTFLTIFPPASSLSSFSAIGLFWPLKQVTCGLPWISDLH